MFFESPETVVPSTFPPVNVTITVLNSANQPSGPFSIAEVRDKLYSGELKGSQMAHVEGLPAWTPLSDVLAYIAKKEQEQALTATFANPANLPPAPGNRPTFAPPQTKPSPGLSSSQLASATLTPGPVPVRAFPGANPHGLPPSAVFAPYPSAAAFNYAPYWQRVIAHILDAICIGIATGIVSAVVWYFVDDSIAIYLFYAFQIISFWLYYSLQESGPQQGTIGKQIFGITVTDNYGNKISFLRATARTFGRCISIMACCIGYLMPAFTEQSKGLHDFIAGTMVLAEPKRPGIN